ncbi:hypothetical protein HPB49_009385 [Dermacentor silvarum]|uniref:Uncharacterized protein n=1 Tax=Dermacentor silvarum TaxID=543639 RepID=A0ACB8DZB7_DERSI|nr:hypothetical protein HPB49_009385 [Dermacentor silvarum]
MPEFVYVVTLTAGAVNQVKQWALTCQLVIAVSKATSDLRESQNLKLWAHLRRPFGVAVGMLCQFVMMPLLAFGLLTSMRLSGLYAIGMLIMACCPGGTVSNVFAYFVDGDVPLR